MEVMCCNPTVSSVPFPSGDTGGTSGVDVGGHRAVVITGDCTT